MEFHIQKFSKLSKIFEMYRGRNVLKSRLNRVGCPNIERFFFKPHLKIEEAKFASSVNCKVEF
jgi:hypothetical protein